MKSSMNMARVAMKEGNGDSGTRALAARNARAGLILAGIALLFFFGIMVKILLLR